jgi:UDP-glucose 4-epimerase
MNKKILITGGAGFIAYHLARRLEIEGHQIYLVDNFSRGVLDSELVSISKLKNIKILNIDCRDKKQFNDIDFSPEIIFHLAAIVGVKNVSEKPYNVLVDNLSMLENIVSFAKNLNKFERLLFSSTSEVYAGTLENFNLIIPTKENSPLTVTELSRPRTSYMLSKIYGEAICHHSGLPFTIFRPHNVYGPRMGMSHVIPQQLYKAFQAKNGESIEVPSGNQTRSFCYIDDAIEILFRMMNNNICKGKTLNLGAEKDEIKISDVVKMCWNINNKKVLPIYLPSTEGSPERRVPNMTETLKILGNINYTSLEDGIAYTHDWYLKNIFNSSIVGAF